MPWTGGIGRATQVVGRLISMEWKANCASRFGIATQTVSIICHFLRSGKTGLCRCAPVHLPGYIFLIGHVASYPQIYPQVYSAFLQIFGWADIENAAS